MEKKIIKSRSYRDLKAWQLAIEVAKEIYRLTGKFPPSENYGLTSQIRRAAVSIPSNIAEGQGRTSAKEFKQFLSIALGSIAELETQIIIATEIGYTNAQEVNGILDNLDNIRKMVKALAQSLMKSN